MTGKLPHFTLRRAMILVAATGVALGGWVERRSRFLRLADDHIRRAGKLTFHEPQGRYRPASFVDPAGRTVGRARRRWHFALAEKYREAARRPFPPVAADPPCPPEGTR